MQKNKIKIIDAYPLFPSQRGFLVDSFAGGRDLYHQQICVELKFNISLKKLTSNIRKVVFKSNLLRTVFDWSEDKPLQIILGSIDPIINIYRVTDQNDLKAIMQSERRALKPIDESPPIRFALIKKKSKLYIVITYHHILLDGYSIESLLQQIIKGEFFPEFSATSYMGWLVNNVGSAEYEIWKKLLNGVDELSGKLPDINNARELQSHNRQLEKEFTSRLFSKAKVLEITPAAYMQTLWSEWSLKYFNKKSFLYGLVVSTRIPGLSDQSIGPYISTVPWYISSSNYNTDKAAVYTFNNLIKIRTAKHIPLGDIAKNISSNVIGFDALLTITTNPIRDTKYYSVVTTYENTGYGLSADIEISNGVNILFSGSLVKIQDALKSFVDYCENQIVNPHKIPVNERLPNSRIYEKKYKASNLTAGDVDWLISLIAQALGVSKHGVDPNLSFLEQGGDSIAALRLKSLLQADRLDVSVADILKTRTTIKLLDRISPPDDTNLSTASSECSSNSVSNENITMIPPSAKTIVDLYRLGYDQDYHEQSAFMLDGVGRAAVLEESLEKLSLEYPTLRIFYPENSLSDQMLSLTPRTSFEIIEPKGQSFEEFVKAMVKKTWRDPIKLNEGPLFRFITSQEQKNKWYIFLSFSALVTDGWSFATILERLFRIYDELLNNRYSLKPVDQYLNYSATTVNDQAVLSLPMIKKANKTYSSEIIAKDYAFSKELTRGLKEISKLSRRTLSDLLMELVIEGLTDQRFYGLLVYQEGRNKAEYFESVGPYNWLLPKIIDTKADKLAYYVFENYPRGSENRLKNGEIKYFKELANWRRDLLPPMTSVGYIFDVVNDILVVRLIVRKHQDLQENILDSYWNFLKGTVKKTVLA